MRKQEAERWSKLFPNHTILPPAVMESSWSGSRIQASKEVSRNQRSGQGSGLSFILGSQGGEWARWNSLNVLSFPFLSPADKILPCNPSPLLMSVPFEKSVQISCCKFYHLLAGVFARPTTSLLALHLPNIFGFEKQTWFLQSFLSFFFLDGLSFMTRYSHFSGPPNWPWR